MTMGALADGLKRDAEDMGLLLNDRQASQLQGYLGLIQK